MKDDYVRITWAEDKSITLVSVQIIECGPPDFPRGTVPLPKEATAWDSTPRKSLFGPKGSFLDIRTPEQWFDPAVLTPGSSYALVVRFETLEPQTKRLRRSCVLTHARLSGAPTRPPMFGDARFASLGFWTLIAALTIVPLGGLMVATLPALKTIPVALRGDADFGHLLQSFAQDASLTGFVRTYCFAAAAKLVIDTRLPFFLATQVDPADADMLGKAVLILGKISARDWPIDRLSFLDELGLGEKRTGKKRR